MSFFTRAQGTSIKGRNVTMNAITYACPQARDRVTCKGFDILRQNTTPSAIYGSTTSDPAKELGCLHGTRLDVQDHVVRWLNDPNSKVAMWMYGPAGIGKTAIAQTVAKLCEEQQQLSSAFFFFRSDNGRNSAKHLVPTLAFEMVQQMPHTRDVVCTPIASNPLIFSAPLGRQMKAIILPSISAPFPSSQNMQRGPMLFIIDGLDECDDTGTQISIIRLFISLLSIITTAVRYKILIVSRPEPQIVSAFYAADIAPHVHDLCLDQWRSIVDIEVFLRAELDGIKRAHPLKSYLAADWPSAGSFKELLAKSFESFAYATLAVRYISSHDRHPAISLNNLLGLTPDCAYEAHAELDSLYRHILESLDERTRYIVLGALCLHTTFRIHESDEIYASILGEDTSAVTLAILKMSSVLRLNKTSHWYMFSYYHTSFSDFLMDKTRSGALCLYSSSVAMPVAMALTSRLWVHATTSQTGDYYLMQMMDNVLDGPNIIAEDMQIHMLNAFIATPFPAMSSASENLFLPGIFLSIDRESRSKSNPAYLRLLYCQAFEHLAAWLRSHISAGNSTSETIMDICFIPHLSSRPYTACEPKDILFHLVRRSNAPWCTICQLLPWYEPWRICLALVRIYLAIPQETRAKDMRQHVSMTDELPAQTRPFSVTTILIHFLQSEITKAEVCHVLEKIVSQANLALPGQITTQDLISFYLSQDTCMSTQLEGPNVRDIDHTYAPIAQVMDSYIRKVCAQVT